LPAGFPKAKVMHVKRQEHMTRVKVSSADATKEINSTNMLPQVLRQPSGKK
jgi:hypothetical protein